MMTQRWLGFYLVAAVAVLLAVALGLEYFQHLRPCNLCILQRLAFIGCGLAGFVLWLLPVRIWVCRLSGTMLVVASLAGLSLATRQIWLQHLPADQVPACGPGFQYIWNNFPLGAALKLLLSGDGDCAAVDWRFLGFSMAVWSSMAFVLLFVYSLKIFSMKKKAL